MRNSSGHFAIFRTRSIAFEPLTKIKDVEDNFIDLSEQEELCGRSLSRSSQQQKNHHIIGQSNFPKLLTMTITSCLKLVKSYPFHTISASYRGYSEMSHEALTKLSNATEGMIIIRPPIYFQRQCWKSTLPGHQWISQLTERHIFTLF